MLKKEVIDLNFYRMVVGEGRGRGPIRSKLFWGWIGKVNQNNKIGQWQGCCGCKEPKCNI